jgi:3-mercaptopropionate dioxygenase
MTTQQSLYTLDHFTENLDRIVRAHSNGSVDARAIVTEARPYFSKLLSDTSWMDPKFRVPEEGKSVSYMMAKAPDGVWTVVSVVWWPGYSTAVHDHLIWGLVGVHEGVEEEERYTRLDDGSRQDYAELRKDGAALNEPGGISHLVPYEEDIHLIRNPGDTPSMSIHVYGGHLDQVLRNQYDLETGEIKKFRSSYKVTC